MAEDEILKYKALMAQHKQSLVSLEAMLETLNVEAITEKNALLVEQLEEKNQAYETLRKRYEKLQKQYSELRVALTEQILSEKMTHMNMSQKRVEKLFADSQNKMENHLQTLEKQLTDGIKLYEAKTLALNEAVGNQYREELLAIKARLKPDIEAAKQTLADEAALNENKIQQAYTSDNLKAVPENLIEKIAERKGFEFKWGLNVINKLGVLLVLFAVVLAGQYTYKTFLGDYAKGITFYLIGAALIGGGEFLNRKKYTGLAMSLIGGGIGVLYTATFISTFYLHILQIGSALAISVLIAGLSIGLSWVYRSQVLGALSIVGGYLPVFTYVVVEGLDALPVLGAICYLLILNGVILAFSMKNRWQVVLWIGFVFNLICVDPLLFMLDNVPLAIGFTLVNFATYLTIVIYRNLKQDIKLIQADIALMLFNTLGHTGILYALINQNGESPVNGLIALGFGTLYLSLGLWLKKTSAQAKLIIPLYMMAACFSILVIPMQFDLEWWFFGWLLEALFFMSWGIQSHSKIFERTGWGLFTFSTLIFWLDAKDLFSFSRDYLSIIDAKYLGSAVSFAVVVWLYRHVRANTEVVKSDEKFSQKYSIIFRYEALTYLIGFMFGEGVLALNHVLAGIDFVEITSILVMVIVLAVKIGETFNYDKWINADAYKCFIYSVGAFMVFVSNFVFQDPQGIRAYIELLEIVLQNYFVVVTLILLFKQPKLIGAPTMVRSIVVSGYMFVAYYLNFVIRVHTPYDGILINLSLIGFSIAYIVYGFMKRDGIFRKLGLIISFVATGKLLIFDSLALPLGQKILSYFAFGVSLIAISYVYQRINAKWAMLEVEDLQNNSEKA